MYEPLASDAPVYQHLNSMDTPLAKELLSQNLIIPSHEKLTEKEIDYVVNMFHGFYS